MLEIMKNKRQQKLKNNTKYNKIWTETAKHNF